MIGSWSMASSLLCDANLFRPTSSLSLLLLLPAARTIRIIRFRPSWLRVLFHLYSLLRFVALSLTYWLKAESYPTRCASALSFFQHAKHNTALLTYTCLYWHLINRSKSTVLLRILSLTRQTVLLSHHLIFRSYTRIT